MRSEIELILSCARTFMDAPRIGHMRALLRKDIDWDYVLDMGTRQGVIALIYQSLKGNCAEGVPESVLDQLREHYSKNLFRNLFLSEELIRILELFDRHHIRAIPLKGAVLSSVLYGDLSLRKFDDLDILVRKRDVLKASRLLTSLDYQPSFPLLRHQEAYYLGLNYEYPFRRKDNRGSVEIHWSPTDDGYSFSLDPKSLWDHTETVSFEGKKVETFAPEDQLLFLCTHGTRHHWNRLIWICDICELIHRYPSLDWQRIREERNMSGGRRVLSLGIFLAWDLLQVPVPEDVLEWVQRDPLVKELAQEVYDELFGEVRPQPGFYAFKRKIFYFRSLLRLEDQIRACLTPVLVPSLVELQSLRLPSALFPLYYLFRPVRLTAKHMGFLLKRFLR